MQDFAHVDGKKFAVVFVEDDDSQWLMSGVAKWRDGHLLVHRGKDVADFLVPDETLDLVRPVDEDLRDVFGGAEYFTLMSIGPLPENADPEDPLSKRERSPGPWH